MKLKSSLLFGIALTLPVSAASFLTLGHMDAPAFGYVSVAEAALDNTLTQGFEPHMHNAGGADGSTIDGVQVTDESEYEPGDVTIVVPEISTTTLNGTIYYWLPQDESDATNNGTPFLGVGLEELNASDWGNGVVRLAFRFVSGPGSVVIWQDGVTPDIFFASDGDSRVLAAGSHTHFNWGFSALGNYELEFTISGNHEDDGIQRASGIYSFAVVPEPSTALLGALGALGLLRRRR